MGDRKGLWKSPDENVRLRTLDTSRAFYNTDSTSKNISPHEQMATDTKEPLIDARYLLQELTKNKEKATKNIQNAKDSLNRKNLEKNKLETEIKELENNVETLRKTQGLRDTDLQDRQKKLKGL